MANGFIWQTVEISDLIRFFVVLLKAIIASIGVITRNKYGVSIVNFLIMLSMWIITTIEQPYLGEKQVNERKK